ncbi:MAG TPA: Lrp/AsnC family transcriptional regulator, partial [Thermoanaerobaculia bacterium]|nr:Lrp/AsnC family transcriptional regulator [Thermoanaerobaculia bacterium]
MAESLDALDRQILAILLHDGRTPAAQIADEVGLSRPAVADRIDKLEKNGVIEGTTVVVDPASLGLTVTA